tara:strand:- start:4526 stop:6061 length:1536 start_codon:yes stop_codon:yes gene_type:complete
MSNWSAGYVSDIGYTFGYYGELNPLRIRLAFLNNGLVFPELGTACELGFGQGLSANIHASASITKWYGTDFSPSQAGFARELAQLSSNDAELFDDAFSEFFARTDLPDFDFICMHGIWSWVSDENRKLIVDFIHRKLKVGGVLYISYNLLPGWAAFAPIRHLLSEHTQIMGSEGQGTVNRIDDAIAFAEKLLETKPAYARDNPLAAERVQSLKNQNRQYLAHEYFNRDWQPMHFSTLADWLEPAKMQYACSAHYLDHIEAINFTAEQLSFLNEIPDARFRESVRDFMANQQFRRDYWVKGPRRFSQLDQNESIRAQRVVLLSHRPDVVLEITGKLGVISLNEAIYSPILDVLENHEPIAIGDLESILKSKNIQFSQLIQAIIIMIGSNILSPANDDLVLQKCKKNTTDLNTALMLKARGQQEFAHLASPVTGGAISLGRFNLLFTLAYSLGKISALELAEFVLQTLNVQDQKITKNGKTLETDQENLSELLTQAEVYFGKLLPILKALQVI